MTSLSDRVAPVTGASRGVGHGVALGLAHPGANVFATGRSIKQADLGAGITTITCDGSVVVAAALALPYTRKY